MLDTHRVCIYKISPFFGINLFLVAYKKTSLILFSLTRNVLALGFPIGNLDGFVLEELLGWPKSPFSFFL